MFKGSPPKKVEHREQSTGLGQMTRIRPAAPPRGGAAQPSLHVCEGGQPAGRYSGILGIPNGCGSKLMGSHFGVGAPPILVYFNGDWDVHWGYGSLTHGQMGPPETGGRNPKPVDVHCHHNAEGPSCDTPKSKSPTTK